MKIYKESDITNQVFISINENKKLSINKCISLQYLDIGDDGIFKNSKSWNQFIRSNFMEHGYYRENCKNSTIQKWCEKIENYKNNFVVKVGENKYIAVDPNDLEFYYNYELYYNSNIDNKNLPTTLEIYVTAKIKD